MRKNDPGTALLAEALRGAVGRFVRAVRSQSGTITTAQSEVLAELARSGPKSVTALAALRAVKHQSMRLVVARLVEQGLLTMQPNPDDGRSQLAALTASGKAQVRAQQGARADHLARLLASRLTADERAVLAQAVQLLDRLGAID
jgi:DNA-binding MarR family transcriptional regulator